MPGRKTTKHGGETKPIRRRILIAAREVFLTYGFGGSTTELIQKTARVSKSTMYKYFPSKYELFKSCMELDLSGFLPRIERMSESGDPIESFLNVFGQQYITSTLSAEGIQLSRLVISERQRFPELGQIFINAMLRPTLDFLSEHLVEAHRRKEVNIRNPAGAADQFLGMLRGGLFYECLLGERTPPAAHLERLVASHVETFMAAYRANR